MNPKAKIEYYRRHFEQYCNDQLKISTPNPGEMLPLKLNVPQQMLLERIEAQRKELGYIRYCCCKSRQSTMSTFAQALCFHATATTKQFYALLIANDKDTTKDIFAMSSRFVVHLDDDVRPMTDRSSIQEIVFQNPDKRKRFENPGLGSRIVFQCATNITAGTGGTRHAVHLCLRGDSRVLLASGDAVPINQVMVGDTVVTHTGQRVRVKRKCGRTPHTDLVEVRTWLNCEPLTLTKDHRIFTQRGWVPAGELVPGVDEIGTAIAPILGTRTEMPLPRRVRKRGRGGPKVIEGNVRLDAQFGWAIGYYLAEGSVGDSHLGRSASITFAHHRDEGAYAMRAVSGCRDYITSYNSYDHPNCLTTATVVYGSSLAELFTAEFGRTDEKRIPDWIFEAPREFCEAVVLGYLAGDGSKGIARKQNYECPTIYATSVRLRLLIQLRRLIASLGWGWGGLYRRGAFTDSRGWKCKEAWTLGLNGACAIQIRDLLGLQQVRPDNVRMTSRRRWTQKYRLDAGYVWTKVRSVTSSAADWVYDIEVDHPDHSFETFVGAVANSELSKWERSSVELLFSSILPGLHLRPGTIGIKESTPYVGGDAFREMCEDARNKRGDDVWCFIPWFCDPQNAVPLKEGEKLKLDTEEKRIERLAARGQKKDEVPPIEMRPEQFKWRRKKILDLKSDTMFAQEYPVDFSSGWICLDSQIFDDTIMRESKKNVRFPRRFVEVHPGPQVLTIHKDDGLRDVRSELDYIAIWEEPKPSVTYDIGVDVSVGGRDENDWSVAEVVRRDNREQVAEVHLHIDPLDFGTMLYWLGKFYNTAQLIVEMNGPGFATHGQLSSMAYEYIYIWRHRERDVPTHSTYRGWKTQHDSKQLMVSNTVNAFNHKELIIHSRVLWDEMHEYVQIDPGVFRANSGHDDAITALMIAIQGGKDETFGDDAKEARAQAVDQNEQREQNVALRDDVFAPPNDHGLDAMVQELRGV